MAAVSTSSASAPRPAAVVNGTVKARRQPLRASGGTSATAPGDARQRLARDCVSDSTNARAVPARSRIESSGAVAPSTTTTAWYGWPMSSSARSCDFASSGRPLPHPADGEVQVLEHVVEVALDVARAVGDVDVLLPDELVDHARARLPDERRREPDDGRERRDHAAEHDRGPTAHRAPACRRRLALRQGPVAICHSGAAVGPRTAAISRVGARDPSRSARHVPPDESCVGGVSATA